jgi:hypothetical protein
MPDDEQDEGNEEFRLWLTIKQFSDRRERIVNLAESLIRYCFDYCHKNGPDLDALKVRRAAQDFADLLGER